jgi:hypothetical protein
MSLSIGRMKAAVFIFLFALTVEMGCSGPSHGARGSLPRKVARLYGIDSFDKVEKIKYTFNVKYNGKTLSRSWVWDVAKHIVILWEPGSPPFSYSRDSMPDTSSAKLRKADADFITDQYWLLFPLHLAWDTYAKTTIRKKKQLPIGSGTATCITVAYPATGGYTPGDAFDLFTGKDDTIIESVYRRGNSTAPTLACRWEDNRRVGPLLISFSRPGADSTFHVWFSDVAIQLKGSAVWTF